MESSYRKCVGAVIINENNEVLLCERIDSPNSWQMPQGGVEDNEEQRTAIFREILEEVGIKQEHLEIIACAPRSIKYDVPVTKLPSSWNNEYVGQDILFFLIKFSGNDSNINLNYSNHPEFKNFMWSSLDGVFERAIDFKRALYKNVISELEVYMRLFADFHKIYNADSMTSDVFVND